MAASASSEILPKLWQVFINFRGKDLRGNFISHLEGALNEASIKYYMDTNEVPSEHLSVLFTRIEQSDIALVIFSPMYAESEWCLDELVKIMEQVEKGKMRIIPVFFNVTPEEVKEQKGEFGLKLYGEGKNNRQNIPHWENALQSVPGKIGLDIANFRDERVFVDTIVDSVKEVLVINTSPTAVYPTDNHGITSPPPLPPPAPTPPQYRVFINFRGNEIRRNFVAHLQKAMKSANINVFLDEAEIRGTKLQNLFERIEESRVAVSIFSERYTESNWCLDELVKMKEQMDRGKLVVIPVFYKLSATTCKHLEGAFGDNFRRLAREYRSEPERINKWEEALEAVSSNIGLKLDPSSDESIFVESIVKHVKKVLTTTFVEERQNSQNPTRL